MQWIETFTWTGPMLSSFKVIANQSQIQALLNMPKWDASEPFILIDYLDLIMWILAATLNDCWHQINDSILCGL